MPQESLGTLALDEQRVLDFCAGYEFREGTPTPETEVRLLGSSSDQANLKQTLQALKAACLVEIALSAATQICLTSAGVVASSTLTQWDRVGSKLLAYLTQRLERERSAFKRFTFRELKDAEVVEGDHDFGALVRLMAVFALNGSGGHSKGPPPSGEWGVPHFLVDLRGVRSLAALHDLLVRMGMRKPRVSPTPTRSQRSLSADVADLARLLLFRTQQHDGSDPPFFGTEDLARTLGWTPGRFNSAMRVHQKRGWLDVDPTGGTHPFDARGFQPTEDGILAFERICLDQRQPFGEAHGVRRPVATLTRSVLFMDLAGWSKLSPPQLVAYLERALPSLAKLIQEHGAEHVNTWGDALVATFGSAKAAAECALDVRDFFRRTPEAEGVPVGLAPRIALHLGETIIAHNPLLGRTDIFGRAVHLAARLEPITEQGEVYCTVEFAKALDAVRGMGPAAHALGEMKLPKDFGTVDVFSVTGPHEKAPPAPAVASTVQTPKRADGDARISLTGWLNKLPVSKSGEAQAYEEIALAAAVSAVQVREQLPSVVQAHGGRWSIQEAGETVVILRFAMPEPTPRRSIFEGGGY